MSYQQDSSSSPESAFMNLRHSSGSACILLTEANAAFVSCSLWNILWDLWGTAGPSRSRPRSPRSESRIPTILYASLGCACMIRPTPV